MMYMNREGNRKMKGQVAVMEYRITGRTGNMRSVLNMAERKIANHGIQDHGKNGKYEERAEYGGAEDRERPGEDQ